MKTAASVDDTPDAAARSEQRPRPHHPRWAALGIGALLVLTAGAVVIRLATPTDNTSTRTTHPHPDGEDIGVLTPSSSLRTDDVILAIGGHRIVDRSPPHVKVGETVTYSVLRDGQPLDVDVVVGRFDLLAALRREWASIALAFSALLVGAYVFVRRPNDRAARQLCFIGGLLVFSATGWVFPLNALDLAGGIHWWANIAALVAYMLLWPAMLHFTLIFPEPAPALRRHPRAVLLVYLLPLVAYLIRVAAVLPGAQTPLARIAAIVPDPLFVEVAFPALILLGFVMSYRRATTHSTRVRLRWVAGAFAIGAVSYLVLWKIPELIWGHSFGHGPWHLLLFLLTPVAIAVAILRVHLFEINVVIRRSLVYACLTVTLGVIYLAVLGVVSMILEDRARQLAIVVTVFIAVLISPLHRRIRRAISRMLYGDRDDPYTIVSRLGERLEATPAPLEVLPRLVTTVSEALRLPYVAVELMWPDGAEEAARHGTLVGAPLVLPLVNGGELIGQLIVGERAPGEGFGKRDESVLHALARQIVIAVNTARLALELQRSRERLVAAREEERRRLQRDLHDGLGPTLAAAVLQAQTAGRMAPNDPDAAVRVLRELSGQIQNAITDVRGIVDDLRPTTLDQLGLIGALNEQALRMGVAASVPDDDHAVQIVVEADGDFRDLPAAVEVAAFRIVSEALTNAVRHGHAKACVVSLSRDERLRLNVLDDGSGLPVGYRAGVGLESMRERAAELGGSFVIEPRPEGGTRVSAELPLPV